MRIGTLIVVTFLAALIPLPAFAQGRPAGVQTDIVEIRAMIETVTVFGQIVSLRESDVATRVAGIINEVPVGVSSGVKKGDVLAQLDVARLGIELASAQAELAIANAGLEVAKVQAERAESSLLRGQKLIESSSISDAQLDERASLLAEAQGGLALARARISVAQNAIDLAQYNITNATVRAPFDGIVLDVATQAGQFASSGSTVATLLDTGTMEVQANVPSRYIQSLITGRVVEGKNDAGSLLAMTLRAVLPTEFSETRTRPVRFTLTQIDPTFAIGQPVTLEVPIGAARDVLVVSKDALVQTGGGWTAFVNDEGKAAPRSVTIGASLGNTFEVLDGLAPGDEVVVRGNERLRPGQDIAPIGAGGPGNPATRPADVDGQPRSNEAESEAERG